MRAIQRKNLFLLYRSPFFITGVLVLFVGAGAFAYISRSVVHNDQVAPHHFTSATASAERLHTVSEVTPSSNAPTASSEDTVADPATTPTTGSEKITPITMGSTNCSALMSKQEEAYNQEIKQERRSLDSSLSIQLGLSISSDIVAGFNKTAAAILNKYAAAAKTSNCTFPVKQPPVLPLTYQP